MLALIVGQGALPKAVAQAQTTPPLICALEGFVPDGPVSDITFRIETLGSLLAMLKHRGVTQVCLCGRIRRPQIDLGLIDDLTMPLVPQLRDALKVGDDGALRVVMQIFEAAGFAILAAHEAAPALLPKPGVLSELPLPDGAERDAAAGDAALVDMGQADLGQACVVIYGQVQAREDDAGTDAMLAGLGKRDDTAASDPFTWAMDQAGAMLGGAADWLSGDGARKGILFKAPKPGQDRRADLPTIGPGTVKAVARAGLAGIVIEAGGVIVLDQPRVIADINAAGLFFWVRPSAGQGDDT